MAKPLGATIIRKLEKSNSMMRRMSAALRVNSNTKPTSSISNNGNTLVNNKTLLNTCTVSNQNQQTRLTLSLGEEFTDESSSLSLPLNKHNRLFSKQYHPPSIKQFDRDLIEGTGIYAFRPYINLVAPLFVKNVLDNQQLMTRLDTLEQQVVQRIIQHIYQQESIEFQSDTVHCLCRFLYILDNCCGELVEVKRELLQTIQQKIDVANVLDVLDIIGTSQELLGYDKSSHKSLLDVVKSFCFSFIRQHVFEDEFDFKLNPRVEKHVLHFYNKKDQDYIQWYETSNESSSSSSIFERLFRDGDAVDCDFTIDFGDGIFVRAHKTILASNSLFFESMLSSNTDLNYMDVDKGIFYPDNSINSSALYCIMEYCYGILNPTHITQHNILSLIQMAHEHDISTLMDQCLPLLRQHIRLSNILEMFQFCEQFFDKEPFNPFTNMIISFGSLHAKSLFHAYNKQTLSSTPLTMSAIFELHLKK